MDVKSKCGFKGVNCQHLLYLEFDESYLEDLTYHMSLSTAK